MLRDYQIELAHLASEILRDLKIVYLAIEMRVGKTLIALKAAELMSVKNVLFITKKKAIESIKLDYSRLNFPFNLNVTNYEQVGKLQPVYDLIIVDEAHSLGAFPKPSLRTKNIKKLIQHNYLILLSGTPSPESYSQLYHQFWISDNSPFKPFANFYKWAHNYVNIKQRFINGVRINDYSDAKVDDIVKVIAHYFITYTQQQAGFKNNVLCEQIIYIDINPIIYKIVNCIVKDRYYKFPDGKELICDTPAKLQTKVHQLYSGTVKLDSGVTKVLDISKLKYILSHYLNKKVAIYYKFIAEGIVLKKYMPNWTEDPQCFNNANDKIFISQISAGSMGINLSTADIIIFYNIDFSAVQYWQARARMQDIYRNKPAIVHWLFAVDGIEKKVYDVVLKKKDYTVKYFKRDFINGKNVTKKDNRLFATAGCVRS